MTASQTLAVDKNRRWLKRERERLGWSTTDVAENAKLAAREFGDPLKLSQQLVSAFENGRHKTTPRWLGYVQLAMLAVAKSRNLPTESLGEAELPEGSRNYFNAIAAQRVSDSDVYEHWLERAVKEAPAAATNDDEAEIDSIDLAYGMGGAFLDSEAEVEKVRFSRTWLRQFTDTAPQHLFSTQGIGDSMMPTILDRDIVIIDRSQNTMVDQMGEKIWAIVFGGVGMIKRLRPLPDGTIKIMSDNQLVRDEVATDGDLFIVGRVVASVRRH